MIDDTPDFPLNFIMITLNSDCVSSYLYQRVDNCVGLPEAFTAERTENTEKNPFESSVNSVLSLVR